MPGRRNPGDTEFPSSSFRQAAGWKRYLPKVSSRFRGWDQNLGKKPAETPICNHKALYVPLGIRGIFRKPLVLL